MPSWTPDPPQPCQPGEHDWSDDYYGWQCRICGMFMPSVEEDDDDAIERAERWHTDGTCDICGGEWGDGWSQCTCEYNPDDPTLNMTIEELRDSTDRFDKAAELAEEGM